MWKVGSYLASVNLSDKSLPQELTHAIVAYLFPREKTVDQAGTAALPHEVLVNPDYFITPPRSPSEVHIVGISFFCYSYFG